uniref:Scaffoldin C n=1 Tax=Ruminococcus flavefaciens TaxID=1265 RepID=G9FES0_RUMFL|nr:scaffoldin C [Ruminococcus flavefaciens]
MKTKKIVVGAIAASMLSLSVCSVAPAVFAAGETVQISASEETAKAGEEFTVKISLADIPSTGIAGIDFAVKFDNTILSIDSVKAGTITETGASGKDPSSSDSAPLFDYTIDNNNGIVGLVWNTMLEESTYWIKNDGVFCTLSGKASGSAANGAVSKIEFVPFTRETRPGSGSNNDAISIGYLDGDAQVEYGSSLKSGSVTVGTPIAGLRGDANEDGTVNMADAVFIMQSIGNPDKYKLSATGEANADVDGSGDVTNKDALRIQQYKLNLITELD